MLRLESQIQFNSTPIFMTGEHWYARFFRDRILPGVASFVTRFDAAKEFVFPISQIGLNYRESPLSQHQRDLEFKVQAGDRMPYFLVDGENVYHRLRAPKFHLIIFTIWKHDYQNLQSEVENRYGDWIDFQTIALYPQVVAIFGSDRPFMVLLRPDYISLLSIDRSSNDLKAYFNKVNLSRELPNSK